MKDWKKIELWRKREKTFTIEVYRGKESLGEDSGENCWNIYVYIYPEHPLFSQIEPSGDMYQSLIDEMPFHGGCSFFRAHCTLKGEITSYQIGCDYRHLHDDAYTFMETEDEAAPIFEDAEKLLAYFEAAAAPPPAPD